MKEYTITTTTTAPLFFFGLATTLLVSAWQGISLAGQVLIKPSLDSMRNYLKEQNFQVFISIARKVNGGAKEKNGSYRFR
jgi:hypothetical protein